MYTHHKKSRVTHLTEDQLQRNMGRYCMNTMRKRTVDEQLVDFADIMRTTVELKIVYRKTELEVTYGIGSQQASVNGTDEATCVRKCKQDILHKLRTSCNYIRASEDTSGFARQTDTPDAMSDIYSEIALSKLDSTRMADDTVLNKTVLIDPGMDSSGVLSEFADSNESPLILKISYFQMELDTSYEFGSCSAWSRDTPESTSIQQCKEQLLHKLRLLATTKRKSAVNQTTNNARKTNCGILNVPQKCIDRVSALMRDLQQNTFSMSTDLFLDILLETYNTNTCDLRLITDFIVRKAIYQPDNSPMYAKLCSDVNRKASENSRECSFEFPSMFKYELIKSCNIVLKEAGLLHQTKPSRSFSQTTPRSRTSVAPASEDFDVDGRIRTLGTCRFMGELFMQNGFKMLNVILRTVNKFMEANDEHSLECLCVLLTIIGSKFEKITGTSETQNYAKQVYDRLTRYSYSGSTDNGRTFLPWRTTMMINQLISLRNLCWIDGQPELPRNVFSEQPSPFATYDGEPMSRRH